MATVTGVWCRELRVLLGYYPTSGDADAAIKRVVKNSHGRSSEDGAKMTLDKISLTI
jgi:hypothetical protein